MLNVINSIWSVADNAGGNTTARTTAEPQQGQQKGGLFRLDLCCYNIYFCLVEYISRWCGWCDVAALTEEDAAEKEAARQEAAEH